MTSYTLTRAEPEGNGSEYEQPLRYALAKGARLAPWMAAEELEELAMDAATAALGEHSGEPIEVLLLAASRRMDALVKARKRAGSALSKRPPLRKLPSAKARWALSTELTHTKRWLVGDIASGLIWHNWNATPRFVGLFAALSKHAGLGLSDERKRALAGELSAFVSSHVVVRCDRCAPGSCWIECVHTIPKFDESGQQVSGVDLRDANPRKGGGRKQYRQDMLFRFGRDLESAPEENHSSLYLYEDAATLIVTEALRMVGLDPSVQHEVARRYKRDLDRDIKAALAGKSTRRTRAKAKADRELSALSQAVKADSKLGPAAA